MSDTTRRVLAGLSSAAAAVALSGGLALAASPVASAGTPGTNIDASGGSGTAVDHDGTMGSFTNSVQGAVDDDGDQDAMLLQSEMAAPQDKAK